MILTDEFEKSPGTQQQIKNDSIKAVDIKLDSKSDAEFESF